MRHGKKLLNSKLKQDTANYVDECKRSYIEHTLHNFSSHVLSNDEHIAHLFGLDQHVPTKSEDVAIDMKLEQFYQDLLKNFTNLPDNELKLKRKN